MALNLAPLESTLSRLEGAIACRDGDLASRHPALRLHLRNAAIHYFKVAYRLSFRIIVRQLEDMAANPVSVHWLDPEEVIREAFSRRLVSEPLAWERYRNNWFAAGYAWEEEAAGKIFADVPGFVDEARHLLARLRARRDLGAGAN